ncbi:MAG: hypothetical protein ACSLFO_08230 [Acidimicrobiales bacterium]
MVAALGIFALSTGGFSEELDATARVTEMQLRVRRADGEWLVDDVLDIATADGSTATEPSLPRARRRRGGRFRAAVHHRFDPRRMTADHRCGFGRIAR